MGKLYAVGFGPGGYEHMTAKAIDVIKNADIITGYTTYVEMLKKFFPEKEYVATPLLSLTYFLYINILSDRFYQNRLPYTRRHYQCSLVPTI